ncbi:MAG: M15 family metallopeptidase [Oscillospiraceae bacterium]|nr:M15 family metallopeptidase [Oscillospiraceae bacterium]
MRKNLGTRIILALLMLVILSSYLYLQIQGYRELRLPQEQAGSLAASAPGQAVVLSQTQSASPNAAGTTLDTAELHAPAVQSKDRGSTAAPEPTVDPETPYGKALANAAAQGLPTPPDIDITSWEYTLVNGEHSIDRYEPEQLAYLHQTLAETDIQTSYNGNRCPVDLRIAEPLIAFGQGCKAAGLTVFLSSGYRSYSDQAANFQRICQNNGISDGKDSAGHYITMPAGCSEHQLALCCDITDRYYQIKNASIEQTATYQWLNEHCAEYGFVQRFPSGKEDITGVMYEPWHFRYVGVEVAEYMTENHLTLEEFLGLYGVE